MRNIALGLVAVAGLCAAPVYAGAQSGLEKGDRVGAYTVLDVTGEHAGTELCYRCKFGNSPVVNVFTKDLNDNVVDLAAQLDQKLQKDSDVKGFFVYLTDDVEKAEKQLKAIAKEKGIKKLPLTIYKDTRGPEGYKLSSEDEVTVLMWNKSRVLGSHTFGAGEMCENCVKMVAGEVPSIFQK